jgi:hypothetical protein
VIVCPLGAVDPAPLKVTAVPTLPV